MSAFSNLLLSLSPSVYWTLDASTGATDQSGNARNGTAGGVTIGGYSANYPPIQGAASNTCTDFDNTDDRVSSSYAPFTSGARSFLAWAYRTSTVDQDMIIGSSGASGTRVQIDAPAGSSNGNFRSDSGSGVVSTFTAGFPAGAWSFVVLTFDTATDSASWYLNGALVSAQSQTADYDVTPGNFQVGSAGTVTGVFGGQMGHAAAFESILTAQNVADLYTYATGPPANYVHQAGRGQ